MVRKFSRIHLVIITTIISIIISESIVFLSYTLIGFQIRPSEIFIGFLAPLIISSLVTWYLYGIVKKNLALEDELRELIVHKKEEIYLATIHSSQHITNNLLNQLQLIEMRLLEREETNCDVLSTLRQIIGEGDMLMKKLSNVEVVEADEIKKAVRPS